MEKIISFIVENWRFIADVCAALLALVLFISRKKPVKVVDGLLIKLLEALPAFVVAAEEEFGSGHGDEKLSLVIKGLRNYAIDLNPDVNFDAYVGFIKAQVEDILSTPQKKGD